MISETLPNKSKKTMDSSEPTTTFESKKKIVKPSLKYKMNLDDDKFDLKKVGAQMKVKRIKPSILQFNAIKNPYGSRANDETAKALANIIKSTIKSTKLEIDCIG